jgi:hypothetical protein
MRLGLLTHLLVRPHAFDDVGTHCALFHVRHEPPHHRQRHLFVRTPLTLSTLTAVLGGNAGGVGAGEAAL